MIHLTYSAHEPSDEDSRRRYALAMATWQQHFQTGTLTDLPITPEMLTYSSIDMGGTLNVPLFNDVFDLACQRVGSDDVVAFINNDIRVTSNVDAVIRATVERSGGCCLIWRRDLTGQIDGGIDIIAVTPAWWMEHRANLPEMFIALGEWDYVFRVYCDLLTKGQCYADDGAIHEPHVSATEAHRYTNGRRHNLKQALKFFTWMGLKPDAESIAEIIEREAATYAAQCLKNTQQA